MFFFFGLSDLSEENSAPGHHSLGIIPHKAMRYIQAIGCFARKGRQKVRESFAH